MAKETVKRKPTRNRLAVGQAVGAVPFVDLNANMPTFPQKGVNVRPDGKGGWIGEAITVDAPAINRRTVVLPPSRKLPGDRWEDRKPNRWRDASAALYVQFISLCGGRRNMEKLGLDRGGWPAKPRRATPKKKKVKFTPEADDLIHRLDRLEKKDAKRAILKKVHSLLRKADKDALVADGFSPAYVHRNTLLQSALLGSVPEATLNGRRFFPSPADPEVAEAGPLLWRLVPLIRQVLDDYATIRGLSIAERTNLTLRDLKGRRGDATALMKKYPHTLKREYPRTFEGVWHFAVMNLAHLWNWTPGEKGVDLERFTVTDLYRRPSLIDKETPEPRWKRLPLLCSWCCTPILGAAINPCTGSPAVVCSKKCSEKKSRRPIQPSTDFLAGSAMSD